MPTNKRTVFFDLDGTLINTIPDLLGALNTLLAHYKYSPIAFTQAKNYFQHNSTIIFKKIFGDSFSEYDSIRKEYFKIYEARLTQKTELYPGVDQVLDHLDRAGITWGIITNKPYFLAEPLLRHFNLIDRTICLVCPETVTHPKPHPEPLLYACQLMNITPTEALYVGDTLVDIQAAKAANMPLVLACYGFVPDYETLKKETSQHIYMPTDLIQLLG